MYEIDKSNVITKYNADELLDLPFGECILIYNNENGTITSCNTGVIFGNKIGFPDGTYAFLDTILMYLKNGNLEIHIG